MGLTLRVLLVSALLVGGTWWVFAITYSPVMNQLFHTAPIAPEAWLRIFGVALLASLAVAVDKRFRRHIL